MAEKTVAFGPVLPDAKARSFETTGDAMAAYSETPRPHKFAEIRREAEFEASTSLWVGCNYGGAPRSAGTWLPD